MFILVLLGNFLAVILICCGIAASYETISVVEKSMGIFPFLKQISSDLMPSFAGVVLLALIQACRFLEELVYTQSQPAVEEVKPKKTRQKAEAPQNTSYFGAIAQEEAPVAPSTPAAPQPAPAAPSPQASKSNVQPQSQQQGEKLSFFHVD